MPLPRSRFRLSGSGGPAGRKCCQERPTLKLSTIGSNPIPCRDHATIDPSILARLFLHFGKGEKTLTVEDRSQSGKFIIISCGTSFRDGRWASSRQALRFPLLRSRVFRRRLAARQTNALGQVLLLPTRARLCPQARRDRTEENGSDVFLLVIAAILAR